MADRDQGFRKIIVKNYPADTADRDLQIMFEKYGKIEDLFTPADRITKKSRGFTFIRYRRQEDADDAIRGMNGRDIDGFKILVERAAPRGAASASIRGGRDFGRGGGREGRGRGRESWEPPRGRRRSVSPRGDQGRRRFRSQSPPRDHRAWREREDRDFQRRDSREMFDQYDSRNMMQAHGRYGGDPAMEGGPGGMMPHSGGPGDGMHHMMGGPPGPMRGGRKTLLDTPPVPPLSSPNANDGYDGPGGYPPPRGPSQRDGYRGDVDDQYAPASHHDPYPPTRESYGGPPPSRGGPPPSRGGHSARGPPPPASQYSNPPSRGGGGGYYDEEPYSRGPPQSHSSGMHQSQYSSDSYAPPPERGGGQQYRDECDYDNYPSSGRGPPPQGKQDPYYSSSNYGPSQHGSSSGPYSGASYSSGPPNSEYRSSNPSRAPASSNPPPSSYSRDYGSFGGGSQSGYDYGSVPSQRSGYPSESAEYNQGPQSGGYGSGRQMTSDTPPSNPYSQRGSSYSSSATYGSRGNPTNLPPPSATGPGGKDHAAPMGDRYYGGPPSQPAPRAPTGGYSAGTPYGGSSEPPSRGGFPVAGPKGGGYGPGGGQQNVGYSNRGDPNANAPPPNQQPKYGQSFSSMGYGTQGQRGTGPPPGGNRMAPTSTGFMPSQNYTKPGPQY